MNPTTKLPPEPETREQKTPLDAVIDEVKQDAEKAPEVYARETIVPEGGE